MSTDEPVPADARGATTVLVLSVLAVFTAQQSLTPVLAPLAREVGLPDVALGVVMTVAAVLFALSSLAWGRVLDRWGQRRTLLTGLSLCLAGTTGFALTSVWATSADRPAAAVLTLMVLSRSVCFGLGVGAVPVAAMAWVARRTPDPVRRTAALGRLGAVQGLAIALGPALGAALGFAGLLGPVWAGPAVVTAALVGVWLLVPSTPAGPVRAEAGDRPAPLRPWDHRVWPYFLAGFLLFLTLGLVLIVIGFLLQDRVGLDAAETVRASGLASFLSGVVLVLTQGLLVPRLAWPPARLLRVGSPIAAVAVATLALAPDQLTITAALAVMALGLGLAMPGYTSAPTMLVGDDEQGSVAGLVGAVNGSTFVIGPLLGTALYGAWDPLPMLLSAGCCTVATLFVWLHPATRRTPAARRPAV